MELVKIKWNTVIPSKTKKSATRLLRNQYQFLREERKSFISLVSHEDIGNLIEILFHTEFLEDPSYNALIALSELSREYHRQFNEEQVKKLFLLHNLEETPPEYFKLIQNLSKSHCKIYLEYCDPFVSDKTINSNIQIVAFDILAEVELPAELRPMLIHLVNKWLGIGGRDMSYYGFISLVITDHKLVECLPNLRKIAEKDQFDPKVQGHYDEVSNMLGIRLPLEDPLCRKCGHCDGRKSVIECKEEIKSTRKSTKTELYRQLLSDHSILSSQQKLYYANRLESVCPLQNFRTKRTERNEDEPPPPGHLQAKYRAELGRFDELLISTPHPEEYTSPENLVIPNQRKLSKFDFNQLMYGVSGNSERVFRFKPYEEKPGGTYKYCHNVDMFRRSMFEGFQYSLNKNYFAYSPCRDEIVIVDIKTNHVIRKIHEFEDYSFYTLLEHRNQHYFVISEKTNHHIKVMPMKISESGQQPNNNNNNQRNNNIMTFRGHDNNVTFITVSDSGFMVSVSEHVVKIWSFPDEKIRPIDIYSIKNAKKVIVKDSNLLFADCFCHRAVKEIAMDMDQLTRMNFIVKEEDQSGQFDPKEEEEEGEELGKSVEEYDGTWSERLFYERFIKEFSINDFYVTSRYVILFGNEYDKVSSTSSRTRTNNTRRREHRPVVKIFSRSDATLLDVLPLPALPSDRGTFIRSNQNIEVIKNFVVITTGNLIRLVDIFQKKVIQTWTINQSITFLKCLFEKRGIIIYAAGNDTLFKMLFRFRRICKSCKKSGNDETKMKRCGACSTIYYCSKECQRKDWKRHKKLCKKR